MILDPGCEVVVSMKRTKLHIVGGESRSRAEQARIAFALGHHAEVYADLDEMLAQSLTDGILLAADDDEETTPDMIIGQLAKHGVWLPVVMVAADPKVERVVSAIKAGALDYLCLPLEIGSFARRLSSIIDEAATYAARRRRQIEAHVRIALLSPREREVLELLSSGCSNKEIGHNLGISARTVEIHRANMMGKLGAGHPADAVRLWFETGFTPEPEATVHDDNDVNMVNPFDQRIGRMLRRRGLQR